MTIKRDQKAWLKRQLEKRVREYRRDVLADDTDNDWTCILAMLRYKIERTRKHILKHGNLESRRRIAREMAEVSRLIRRVEENVHFDEANRLIHKKYGKAKMVPVGKSESGATSYIIRYERETPRNSKKLKADLKKAWKAEDRLRAQDLKKAFDLMAKQLWDWWN